MVEVCHYQYLALINLTGQERLPLQQGLYIHVLTWQQVKPVLQSVLYLLTGAVLSSCVVIGYVSSDVPHLTHLIHCKHTSSTVEEY